MVLSITPAFVREVNEKIKNMTPQELSDLKLRTALCGIAREKVRQWNREYIAAASGKLVKPENS